LQAEIEISKDFEPYNDEEELRRLIRAVRLSKKHYLYFVCCNQVPKQNELIKEVKKNFKGKKIKVVKFKRPVKDLLGELQKRKIGAECEAVFVQGLEYSISSDDKGGENALIYNLNISRDSFKRYLNCPLFLWLPEYALVKITRHAPDFFSVRSGTFYFSNPPEKVTEQIIKNVSSRWLEYASLPVDEKHRQIKILENLLAEYRGLHSEKQDKEAEMQLLTNLGNFYSSISEFQKAIEYYEQVLILSRKIKNKFNEGISLSNLGNAYQYIGEYRKAIEYHEQSLIIEQEINNIKGECISLANLGNIYDHLGDYQKATNFFETGLTITRKIGDQWMEGTILGNLGSTYRTLGNYEKAIEYHKQHLNISQNIGDRIGESDSLGNIGNLYAEIGDYQKALEYHMQSLIISREVGNQLGETIGLGNLEASYGKLGNYIKAKEYFEKALVISRKIGDRFGEATDLTNLGNIYYSLGEKKKACGLWKEALAIFQEIESPDANVTRNSIKKYCQSADL